MSPGARLPGWPPGSYLCGRSGEGYHAAQELHGAPAWAAAAEAARHCATVRVVKVLDGTDGVPVASEGSEVPS